MEQGFAVNEGVPTAESPTVLEVVQTAESPVTNEDVPTAESPAALEVVPTAESPVTNENIPTVQSPTALEVVPTDESPVTNEDVPTNESPAEVVGVPTAESPTPRKSRDGLEIHRNARNPLVKSGHMANEGDESQVNSLSPSNIEIQTPEESLSLSIWEMREPRDQHP